MKYGTRAHLARLGVIFSNLSIAATVFIFASLFSTLLGVMLFLCVFVFFIVGTVFTIGIALFIEPFRKLPERAVGLMEKSAPILEKVMSLTPYLGVGAIVLCIASIVLLCFEPSQEKHTGRIVGGVLFLLGIVAVIGAIVYGGVK